VRINGYKRGETPLEGAITKPGPVDITVVGPGHRARSIRSELAIGEHEVFEVDFASTSTAAGVGRITVGLEPAGWVDLADGTRLGAAPVVEREVPAGGLELVLTSKDGRYRRRVEVDVPPGELSVYRFRLGPEDEVDSNDEASEATP